MTIKVSNHFRGEFILCSDKHNVAFKERGALSTAG